MGRSRSGHSRVRGLDPSHGVQEALSRFGDAQADLSAAIQLVRLSETSPLCVPEEMTDAHVTRLRVVRLGDDVWALGLVKRFAA